MDKSYKDLTPKERYDSAIEADKADWSPGTEIRKLVRSKLGMDNENMSKGIELKLGPNKKDKPTDLNPVAKKKGGAIKKCCSGGKMAKGGSVRGHGCETKGKTKGKFC